MIRKLKICKFLSKRNLFTEVTAKEIKLPSEIRLKIDFSSHEYYEAEADVFKLRYEEDIIKLF